MNKFSKIIVIVALALAVIGCGLFFTGKALGGSTRFNIGFDNASKPVMITTEDIVEGSIDLDAFDSIDIRVSSIDFKLCKGDSYKLTYKCSDNLIPEVKVENKSLTLKQPKANVNLSFEFGVDYDFKYVLYVPADKIDTLIDASSSYITVEDVDIFGRIQTSSGDVQINNSNGKDISIKTSSGEIFFKNASFDSVTFNSSSGDMNINDIACRKMTLYTSSGEVSINDTNVEEVEITTSSGDINTFLKGNKVTKFQTSSGEVKSSFEGSVNDYSINVKTSSGVIKAGDVKTEKELSLNAGVQNVIDCVTTSGDVDLSFAK